MLAFRDDRPEQPIKVVANFLRYVLQHDVCPEYKGDVEKALDVCELASEELPMAMEVMNLFPGQFNCAVNEVALGDDWLYRGIQKNGYTRPELFDAQGLLEAAIFLVGDEKVQEKFAAAKSLFIVKERHRDLEVISIHRPAPNVAKTFLGMHNKHGKKDYPPIGTAVFKHCRIEDQLDMGEVARAMPLPGEEVLFLDDAILALLKPGFKLRGMVGELNIGVKFVQDIPEILPTFHTFLPQILMKLYKPPVPNERPAPSVGDPFAEDADPSDD
jgi:hypothetical protein